MKRKQRQKEDLEDGIEVGDGEEEEVVDRRRERGGDGRYSFKSTLWGKTRWDGLGWS